MVLIVVTMRNLEADEALNFLAMVFELANKTFVCFPNTGILRIYSNVLTFYGVHVHSLMQKSQEK